MNKVLAIFGLLVAMTSSQMALAGNNVSYDYGRVLSAKPIIETISYQKPQKQCWIETVQRGGHKEYSATGTLLGGVIGAAIGNKVGHKKRNKQVGAVAGALLGASIGNDISRRHAGRHGSYSEEVERCEMVNEYVEEENIVGYNVRYRYHGEVYHARTSQHPGDRIKLRVSVAPVE